MFKKALSLGLGAFFMAGCFSAVAACPASGALQWYGVERVVDGDTLYLAGGEKVRLLGVNTPEKARGGQPLAEQATQLVRKFVADSVTVGLQPGVDAKDRYGRTLAHVFNRDGESLAARLLAQGMGWLVVISPNTAYADCLAAQSQQARATRKGVWALAAYQPIASDRLTAATAGFRQVRGVIDKVSRGRNSWWLESGRLAIRIKNKDLDYFGNMDPASLLGRSVLVSGWVIDRSDSRSVKEKGYKPFLLSLSHPLMMQYDPDQGL